jgi:hypothetical protein
MLAALCLLAAALGLTACGSSSPATTTAPTTVTTPVGGHRSQLLSIVEDDTQLEYFPSQTLAAFKTLGAQVVRYNVLWSSWAPDPLSRTEPAGFDAANPSAPGYNWPELDAIDRDVSGAGLRLYMTVTGSPPLWAATRPPAEAGKVCAKVECHQWRPSAKDYGEFVQALGRRYSGHYTPAGQSTPLPRVSFWSIWNEPNYGPDLAPQSTTTPSHEIVDEAAPQYRHLIQAAWQALAATGHTPATDTILIGETAPVGELNPGIDSMTAPQQFLRDLYCVDSDYRPLTKSVATALACPSNGSRSAFTAQNPGLFKATGWADHPYDYTVPPDVKQGSATVGGNFADFGRLGDLGQALDSSTAAWGVKRTVPVYNTEYGYFTNPPTAQQSLPLATVARYMNWSEYLSWKSPQIASYDQYLLDDPAASADSKFDSGLNFSSGKAKPLVYAAYRFPLWLPRTSGSTGASLEVWGCARPALGGSGAAHVVKIQFAATGTAFRTLKTVTVHPATGGCYFDTAVTFPSSGNVRLLAATGTGTITSRVQAITLR